MGVKVEYKALLDEVRGTNSQNAGELPGRVVQDLVVIRIIVHDSRVLVRGLRNITGNLKMCPSISRTFQSQSATSLSEPTNIISAEFAKTISLWTAVSRLMCAASFAIWRRTTADTVQNCRADIGTHCPVFTMSKSEPRRGV